MKFCSVIFHEEKRVGTNASSGSEHHHLNGSTLADKVEDFKMNMLVCNVDNQLFILYKVCFILKGFLLPICYTQPQM